MLHDKSQVCNISMLNEACQILDYKQICWTGSERAMPISISVQMVKIPVKVQGKGNLQINALQFLLSRFLQLFYHTCDKSCIVSAHMFILLFKRGKLSNTLKLNAGVKTNKQTKSE